MSVLSPTPGNLLVDSKNRPYFLWDSEMTIEELEAGLSSPDRQIRAYLLGKVMRQAKPDDVFRFVRLAEIRELWSDVEKHLGDKRDFWRWLLERWR